jgi:hypothetical protein
MKTWTVLRSRFCDIEIFHHMTLIFRTLFTLILRGRLNSAVGQRIMNYATGDAVLF